MLDVIEIDWSNIQAVAELVSEIHKEEHKRTQLTASEAKELILKQFSGTHVALALSENREIVGFGWMYERPRKDACRGLEYLFQPFKKVFYLADIGIKKECRGQGYGTFLLRALLRQGRERGANVVVLSTHPENKDATSLYSRVGFQNSGIESESGHGSTYWIYQIGPTKA